MFISKKKLVIVGIVLVCIISFISYFAFSKTSLLSNANKKEVNNSKENIILSEKEKKENTIEKSENESSKKASKTNMIDYFNNLNETVFSEKNIKKYSSKAKTKFIEITDFLFYGREINGITFNSLKDDVKIKIMSIVLKIDSKMEKVFPGYKTQVKLGVTNLKESIVSKYLEVSNKICSSNRSDACIQAKEGLKSLKDSFGLTFEIIKALGKSGLESIKDWYEVFREN